MKRFQDRYLLFGGLVMVVGVSFLFYGITAARLPVGYADAEDLILAGFFDGLAHPPGYPILIKLLHWWLDITSVETYLAASYLSAILQSLANGMFFLILVKMLKILNHSRDGLVYVAALLAAFVWATSSLVWTHATLMEVFAMSQLMILICGWLTLNLFEDISSRKRAVAWAVTSGVAASFHPLNWIVVLSSGGLIWWQTRRSSEEDKRNFWFFMGLMFFIFGTVTLIGPMLVDGKIYSWNYINSWQRSWDIYLRLDYVKGGSAIETYAGKFDIEHSMVSIGGYLKHLSQEFLLMGVLFGFLGGVRLWKISRPLFYWLVTIFLISGPVLAFYMKFPRWDNSYDIEYFWGWSLRWRMMYVSIISVSILAALGMYEGINMVREKWGKNAMFGVLIGLGVWAGVVFMQRFDDQDLSDSNFVHLYSSQILKNLPDDSLLVVDSDMVFSFLYQQMINEVRPDVIISPVGIKVRPSEAGKSDLLTRDIWNEEKALVLIRDALGNEQRVFLYDPSGELINKIGLEGNPFYGIVHGYVVEVAKTPPTTPNQYDYGLSVQLFEFDEAWHDWWTKGLKAHVASAHTRASYYAARAGDEKLARIHKKLAKDLSFKQNTIELIESSLEQGVENYEKYDSYLNYVVPTVEQYVERSENALTDSEKEFFLTRAWMRYPDDPRATAALVEYYQRIGDLESAMFYRELDL